MPAIGDTLREARMRQKLDIADVEERTKIRAKYLRALENEEFGLLPGSTFVKTFLRTYAEALGLDPHALLNEYRANYEPRDEAEIAPLGPPVARERERRRYGPGPPRPGTLIAVIVVAVLGFLLVLGLSSNDEGGKRKRSASAPAGTETQPPRRKKRSATPARPLESVTLKVEPVVPTYACVDTGAGTAIVYQGILQQARTFKGRTLRVNLGKSSPKLTVNGKPLPVEPSPNPVGYELTPKATKPLPVGQRPCA
jgi:transcriptional regulator with XRE-family HTH domain